VLQEQPTTAENRIVSVRRKYRDWDLQKCRGIGVQHESYHTNNFHQQQVFSPKIAGVPIKERGEIDNSQAGPGLL